MGVDIQTYRCRIGTFGHGIGSGISTTEHLVDFTLFSKTIGTVMFIGTLLLMAGIEPNPGPRTGVSRKMGVDIQTYRCRISTFGHAIGSGISTTEHLVDFTQFSKTIGTVMFIGTLLLMAGIEPNPGPRIGDGDYTTISPDTTCLHVDPASTQTEHCSRKCCFKISEGIMMMGWITMQK